MRVWVCGVQTLEIKFFPRGSPETQFYAQLGHSKVTEAPKSRTYNVQNRVRLDSFSIRIRTLLGKGDIPPRRKFEPFGWVGPLFARIDPTFNHQCEKDRSRHIMRPVLTLPMRDKCILGRMYDEDDETASFAQPTR